MAFVSTHVHISTYLFQLQSNQVTLEDLCYVTSHPRGARARLAMYYVLCMDVGPGRP